MTYARYLSSITTALRETVLPELQSGRAKDTVNLSISVIAAIAANLGRPATETLTAIDAGTLPAPLAGLVPSAPSSPTGVDAGIVLPRSTPSDDFALTQDGFSLLEAGAEWLASAPWPTDPALASAARALLNWDNGLRQDAIGRVRDAEQGLVATTTSAGVPDINQPALEKYLRQRFESDTLRVTEFRFLEGGRARQTGLFSVEGYPSLPSRLVVQREHPGSLHSLSGVGMQYPLLEAAYLAGMKVARPVVVELSPEALGAAFMITEQLSGSSPIASMDYWGVPPKSPKLAANLAKQFALMHSIPLQGLEKVMVRYVDPAKGGTQLSHIASLEEKWTALRQAPSMAMSATFAWLRAHSGCVEPVETVVHNDALLHNLLTEGDEITAVLDWEMAHIGNPFEDLGYVRPVVEQMTDWNDFVDAYVAHGGRRPTQEQMDYFTLRAIVELAVLVASARSAFDSGRTNDLVMAEVGASFLPKLVDRIAVQLNRIVNA